jgi:hypothetical protein
MLSEEAISKAKEGIKDNKKLSEVIEKLKNDRSIVPNTIKLIKENPQIERNARSIARDIGQSSAMGQEVPLNERIKMQKRQELIKNMAKQNHKEGDVQCVNMTVGGKMSSYMFSPNDLDQDKWSLSGTTINSHSIVAICKTDIYSGSNKVAKKILGKEVYGPVIFMLLDEEYIPINLPVNSFKSMLENK